MPAEDVLTLVLRITGALAPTVLAAIQSGNVSTLDELRKFVPTPDGLAAMDDAVVAAQDAKARAALGEAP